MESIFMIAAVVSIIFFIMKFIEMRFIEKENKPLKFLIRDALLVYFSVVFGYFIFEQFNLPHLHYYIISIRYFMTKEIS